MWFDILFWTWDYLFSMVGVGHLGSMWLGGSVFFTLTIWDPSVDTMARAFFVGIYLHSILRCYILWWMLFTSMFLYIDDYHVIDDVIYFVGSSYALFLHIRFLYAYVVACYISLCLCCSMFRSDVPITIVLMILSVTWDVTHGGWLGPMVV